MKKGIAVFVVLVMLVVMTQPVYAATDNETDVSDSFIEISTLLFTGNGEVYDANGNDITQAFLQNYQILYDSRDYAAIQNACLAENISQIRAHNQTSSQSKARAILTIEYEEYSLHYITQEGIPYDGKTWTLLVTASGTYSYNDGMGQIIAFPTPTISYALNGLGAKFSGSIDSSRTTTPVINSSKTAVTFNTTTTHSVSCPIPGVDYITGTLGPFTTVSYFTVKA